MVLLSRRSEGRDTRSRTMINISVQKGALYELNCSQFLLEHAEHFWIE